MNIDVEDLERGIAFYRDALGLRVGRRLFDGTVAEMLGASSKIYLLEKPARSTPSPEEGSVRDYRRHWTPVHLDFAVNDVFAAMRRAIAAGAKVETEVQTFVWGQQVTLSDLFGHGFCLLAFSGAGYHAVA